MLVMMENTLVGSSVSGRKCGLGDLENTDVAIMVWKL